MLSSEIHFTSDLQKCKEIYFSATFIQTRESTCMTKRISMLSLNDWADAFILYQIETGECIKTPKDFIRHFRFWLNTQNLSLDPKTLNDVTGTSKTTGFNPKPNTPEANNNRKREADDQLNRLFGENK